MDVKKKLTEFKVGIFVILGIAVFTFFIFKIGNFSIGPGAYNIKIIYGFTNGVKMSAPVRVAGVDSGEVVSVRIFFNQEENKNNVEILARLKKEARIPADSKIYVNTLGLLGEKYIEVIPGEDYENFLKEGDLIRGIDPISMQEVTDMAMSIAEKVDAITEGLAKITADETLQNDIKNAVSQLNSSTVALNSVLTKIESGEGTIGKFVNDDSVFKNLNELSADLKTNPWKLFYRPKKEK